MIGSISRSSAGFCNLAEKCGFFMGAVLNRWIVLIIMVFLTNARWLLRAQAAPSATRGGALIAFAGVTGTYTGLGSGTNVGVTGGVDVAIHRLNLFTPYLEIRGTYPFYLGETVSIRNVLGGVRFARTYGRYTPYFDALYGRAELHYANGGYPNPAFTYLYQKSPSNVLSLGGGTEIPLTYTWAIKADAQWQFYSSPVTSSGHLNSVPVTIGIVYRLRSP
jgi:hypothetical protein